MPDVDVLLPNYNRLQSFILTLAGLSSQTHSTFHLIVSDQSDTPALEEKVVQTQLRIIEARGGSYEWYYRVPSKGIAEQRHFLLEKSTAQYVLFLDNDVYLEPWVLQTLLDTIEAQGCGFIGAFPYGLSYREDIRKGQQQIEFWDGKVEPEIVEPDSIAWQRFHLHRAANSYHVSQTLPQGSIRLYKVAWIAACILYDRDKLLEIGGFSFWNRLPRFHSGEEVVVQNLMMRRWGGAAILPSGAYFSELPSTVLNEQGSVDGHALSLLEELIEKYIPRLAGNGSRSLQISQRRN